MRSLLCSCVDLPRKSPKGPPFLKSGALLLASRLTLLRQSSSGQEEAEPNSAFTVLVRVSDLSEIKRGAVRRILREPLIGKTLGLSDWPKHYQTLQKSFNVTERSTCNGFFSSAFFQRACIFLPPTPFPTTGIEMSPSHAVLSRPWLTATSTSSLKIEFALPQASWSWMPSAAIADRAQVTRSHSSTHQVSMRTDYLFNLV
mmetsp:Transcript_92194/g.183638  ORF Transcript_92194/g.183638 Transcript_92194/m.183638 type:complete len:201 (+) Transcript_92194:481-1083(+)